MVYFPYRSPFSSRSLFVRFSFGSRSILVHPSFILRSFSVRESKIDRRTNGGSSEAKRRCIETLMGNQGEGDPNKNFIFIHLILNYSKTYSWLHHFSAPLHRVYWKSMSYVKIMGGTLTKPCLSHPTKWKNLLYYAFPPVYYFNTNNCIVLIQSYEEN